MVCTLVVEKYLWDGKNKSYIYLWVPASLSYPRDSIICHYVMFYVGAFENKLFRHEERYLG